MNVKICGITRFEDAEKAVQLGAWAVGFLFARESPRYIEPGKAAPIIARLPASVEKVGVFVNASTSEMLDVQRETGITLLQLHGEESVEQLKAVSVRTIKALPLQESSQLAAIEGVKDIAWAILIDARKGGQRGGTGVKANWNLAADVTRRCPRVILAGGLDPSNVGEAIRQVNPFAVDVSSGVELAPGVKDSSKMEAFFANVRKR